MKRTYKLGTEIWERLTKAVLDLYYHEHIAIPMGIALVSHDSGLSPEQAVRLKALVEKAI